MGTVQHGRTCQVCKGDKQDAYCPACKKDTPSDLKISVFEEVQLRTALKGQVREGEKGKVAPHYEFIEKEVESGDPRLPDGVHVSMAIDRRGDMYHQTVKDVRTGAITHEEHEPLSQHRSKHDRKNEDGNSN